MDFQVVEYDVWGNAKDGYEVNGAYVTNNIITIEEEATNEDICDWLRGYLYPGLPKKIIIDGDYDFSLYLEAEEDGKPLLELRRVH